MATTLLSRLPRPLSTEESTAYRQDGAAVIRGVLDPGWIERLQSAIDRVIAAPGPMAREYAEPDMGGRFVGDFFVWRRDEDFRAIMADSPLPELAATLLESRGLRFFYDQLLVKEPGTEERTPWHHDLPYWPIRGEQIASIWVPFDFVDASSGAVTYVRGSHRWGRMFAPVAFGEGAGYSGTFAAAELEPMPDLDAEVAAADRLVWAVEPGDVLVHHPLTLHFAPGNTTPDRRRRGLALRYAGDDVVYDDRPGTFLENPAIRRHLPEIDLRDGDPLSGELFPAVWPRSSSA